MLTEEPDKKKKRPNIDIRQMEIDDVASVFHLGEELFTAEEVPTLYRTWDEYEVLTLFQGDPEYCLVAECDDKIIGFCLGTTIEKNHSAWKYGHLVWLGVTLDYQRYGIAGKLFNSFRDVMLESGVRMLLVDTEADNLPAIKFFKKKGFGNPEKHVYMSLNLDTKRKELKEKENGHG
jgi:ribosomal protein S18 acetylase RimI-like enzyme